MLLAQKIITPILVKNPTTGKYVDVAPLFNAMDQFDEPLKKAVSDAVRIVNLTAHESGSVTATQIANVNFGLFLLEDMFEGICNFDHK